MKRATFEHPKLKTLCRRLDMRLWHAAGILETLWHVTEEFAIRGDIGRLTNEDIAIELGYHENEDILIEALVYCRWIDLDPSHRLQVHDWSINADDRVHLKLARAHQTFADGADPRTSRLSAGEREILSRTSPNAIEKPARAIIPISARLRFQILKRDGFKCQYCGRTGADAPLAVDHVKPRYEGGTNEPSNLVTACETCNLGKGSDPMGFTS